MLEAKKGYYFINSIEGNILEKTDKSFYKANHGYCPKIKDYKTIFIASGPKIKKNYEIKEMRLIDEAPTIAKTLDLNLGKVDGATLKEIFLA
jgi:predicted AlkP superfamily pyrophosphatase or phosphodiesterase